MSPEEQRILQLSNGARTQPRFDWKLGGKGDGKCYICENPALPGNDFYCGDRCRKAGLAWNKRFNPGDVK